MLGIELLALKQKSTRSSNEGDIMQVHVGNDILSIKRFERIVEKKGQRFLERFLSAEEISYANNRVQSLAGFFSVKESISKALGTGIGYEGVSWHDIHISINHYGKPEVKFSGKAKEYYDKINACSIDISISHEKKYAMTTCVILTCLE